MLAIRHHLAFCKQPCPLCILTWQSSNQATHVECYCHNTTVTVTLCNSLHECHGDSCGS